MNLRKVKKNCSVPFSPKMLEGLDESWYFLLSYEDTELKSFMIEGREMFIEITKFFYYVIGFKDETFKSKRG